MCVIGSLLPLVADVFCLLFSSHRGHKPVEAKRMPQSIGHFHVNWALSTENVLQRRLSENVQKCKLRSHNTAVKTTRLYVGFACLHWAKQRRQNAGVRITEKHSHLEQAVFGTPFLISKGVGQHVTHLQTSSDRAQWIDLIKYDTFVTDYPTQQYTVV